MNNTQFDDTTPARLPENAWVPTIPSRLMDLAPTPPTPCEAPPPPRKPQSLALTTAAHVWLAKLPPRYQPLTIARQHPHIVNELAVRWSEPADLPAHLTEMLLGTRPGGREGFEFEVISEIADLLNLVEAMLRGEKY
jgi:hypothetical protein